MSKHFTPSDKDIFEYILGSFELVWGYLKDCTFSQFETDIKTQDAVSHRMQCVGIMSLKFSESIKNKHSDFPWGLYDIWAFEYNSNFIFEFAKDESWEEGEFDSLESLYKELEKLYLSEYNLENKAFRVEYKCQDKFLTNDYKYPISSSKSIWVVKNK